MIFGESTLPDRLKYWQSALGLESWTITASIVPMSEHEKDCPGEKAVGLSRYNFVQRVAHITLLRPEDYDQCDLSKVQAYDMEANLVHELLHVLFAGFQDELDGGYYSMLHQAIETLSRALVAGNLRFGWDSEKTLNHPTDAMVRLLGLIPSAPVRDAIDMAKFEAAKRETEKEDSCKPIS